jgi:hypothetical protein
MKLDVKADIRAIQRDLKAIAPLVQKSTVRALSRTVQHVQSQSVKNIANAVSVPQKVIRQRSKISKASPWQLSATLSMNLFPIPIIKLKPKQTKRGVTVARHAYPSAFIAPMPSGHMGVFQRLGKKRLPIQEIKLTINPPADHLISQQLNQSSRYFKKTLEVDLKWRFRR